MKRLGMMMLFGVALCVATARPAHAIKPFNDLFSESYVDTSDSADLKAASAEAKCNVCHFGKTKKNRNDFGMALSKHIKKDDYVAMNKDNPDAAKESLKAALAKAFAEKKEGNGTFAEVIKSGKLPGTNPPEE